jgi:glycosyltransferase involved in cell wall biosynthesis
LYHYIRGIAMLKRDERAAVYAGIELYKACLPLADKVIAPTDWLVRDLASRGYAVECIPNTFSFYEMALAKSHAREPIKTLRKPSGHIVIGYFSGSWTHDKDFEECEDALFSILRGYENVYYLDTGFVTLPERWAIVAHKVMRMPPVPHHLMLHLQAQCDISIAPLEIDNPFCQAKSELKYFEAAIFSVPVVASPTAPMRSAIRDGENGFLASTPADWRARLEALIESDSLRKSIGSCARQDAEARFYAANFVKKYDSLVNEHRLSLPNGTVRRRLEICFVQPDLTEGSGGQRNIFNLSNLLVAFGHSVTNVFKDSVASSSDLKQIIDRAYGPSRFNVIAGRRLPSSGDVLVATYNKTVDFCIAHGAQFKNLAYYVQDFEPWFYPIGSDYFQAEMSYRKIENKITYTSFVKNILRDQYGLVAHDISMFIDRAVYYPRDGLRDMNKILVFARPEMPRRCFDIIVEALELVIGRLPRTKVVFFGSDWRRHDIAFPHEWLGSFNDYNALAGLYSRAGIGIAISPTNPSHMPFEMMACGLPVVDISWSYTRYNSASYLEAVTNAPPDPKQLAIVIEQLLSDQELSAQKARLGLELTRSFNLLPETAREFEKILLTWAAAEVSDME